MSQYTQGTTDTASFTQDNEYNGNGQRIRKVENDQATNYYYNGSMVLYTTDDGVAEDEDAGTPAVEPKITSLNLMGTANNVIATARPSAGSSGSGGSGRPGADSDPEDYYFYHKDTRGSTTNLLDANGEVAASYQYDDFGQTTIHGDEDFDNEICYTSGIYDAEAELYYLNARYYDPEDGRFLTQDTYRGEQNDPGTWHIYGYCSNNRVPSKALNASR